MVQGNRAFVHPLDCQYLIEARVHERPVPLDHATLPNQDIRVTQRFLRDNEPLAVFLARSLVAAALDTPGLVDGDIREALDALIRTYRTLESGLYYETRPNNPLAARMFAVLQDSAQQFRKSEQERQGMTRTRDADVLGVLAFFQRMELDRDNGRSRGRAFIDFLRSFYPADALPRTGQPSPLIVP